MSWAAKKGAKPAEAKTKYPGLIDLTLEVIETRGDEVPEKVKQAVKRRIALLDRAATDREFQREELRRSREDVVHFINNWGWTSDPRNRPSTIPFDLFPRQEDYLRWRQKLKAKGVSGCVEKSRDMGVTWLNVADQTHGLVFDVGYKGSFGSRKEMLVDRLDDPDSIFEKIRILIRHLPEWMRPAIADNYLKITSPHSGGSITGEAGKNLGRGGRSSVYDLDEAAFIEQARRVQAALSENTPVIIYTSTVNIWQPGNLFSQMVKSGSYETFRFHWTDDPRKSEEWYKNRCAQLDPMIVASEIDINHDAAANNVVIPPMHVKAAVELRLIAGGDRVAGLDIAYGGGDDNVLIIRSGPVVYGEHVFAWQEDNPTQTAFRARELCADHKVKHLVYDCVGVGAGTGGTLAIANYRPFTIEGYNGGGEVSDVFYPEFDRQAKDMFLNLRSESWWRMRQRFRKTWEVVNNINSYPDEELISIPNNEKLITQLSQPTFRFNERGRLVIESKIEMKKRGVKSPDHADALVMAFHPPLFVHSTADWLDAI